jgi:hypothetical protein
MNITYKHLRLFAEEEKEGWLAYVYDLDQFRFVYEGRLFHTTVGEAQNEAQTEADVILGEASLVDWADNPTLRANN